MPCKKIEFGVSAFWRVFFSIAVPETAGIGAYSDLRAVSTLRGYSGRGCNNFPIQYRITKTWLGPALAGKKIQNSVVKTFCKTFD